MDPVRLRCAKRNAEIYGVADRINFICIDFFNFCKFHCEKVKQLKTEVKRRTKKEVAGDFEQVQKSADDDGFEVVGKTEIGKIEIERTIPAEVDTDDADDLGIAVDNCHYTPVFDAVLLSPPWGGPSYLRSKVNFEFFRLTVLMVLIRKVDLSPMVPFIFQLFSLKNMEPKGDKIFRITRKLTHNIAYYLPRQTDVKEVYCIFLLHYKFSFGNWLKYE